MAASGAAASCFVFSNLKLGRQCHWLHDVVRFLGDDSFTSRVVDSLFVGETENIGNPTTPEEIAYGRSLPKRLIPDFPIRGYEYYDYRLDVANTTFVNFQDNDSADQERFPGCCSRAPGLPPKTPSGRAKFVNAKPVYFPKIDPRFDSDNRGGVGLPDRGDPRSGRLDDRHP